MMRKEEQHAERLARVKEHREVEVVQSAVFQKVISEDEQDSINPDKEFCNRNYLIGEAEGASEKEPGGCADLKSEHILTVTECKWAAKVMGSHVGNPSIGPFVVNDQWYNVDYPQGCFKAPDENTLWYNPAGMKEIEDGSGHSGIRGRPVCTRPRYGVGKENSTGTCLESDMAPIEDEKLCETFAECSKHMPDKELFEVGIPIVPPPFPKIDNPDTRPKGWGNPNIWPRGCFIRLKSKGSVNFNAAMKIKPTDPKGIPACSRPNATFPSDRK